MTEQQILTVLKKRPVQLQTINNSDICSGLIREEVHLEVVMGEHVETLVLDVADIGDDNMILGINWLRRHNPVVDWERATVDFTSTWCEGRCLARGKGGWGWSSGGTGAFGWQAPRGAGRGRGSGCGWGSTNVTCVGEEDEHVASRVTTSGWGWERGILWLEMGSYTADTFSPGTAAGGGAGGKGMH